MPSILSLVAKLARDFPSINFTPGVDFRWSASNQTVYFDSNSKDQAALLHEVAHVILGHQTYDQDIQLIQMERDAWEYAKNNLASSYDVDLTDDVVQASLDTYRDWLHARSQCPSCKATGLQIKKQTYKCLACATSWKVNEARLCALRRYKLP